VRKGWTVALLLPLACGRLDGFACLEDAQCRRGGNDGTCASGYCAYVDPTCPGGLRWSDTAAGMYAGRCVDPEPPSTTTSESGTDLSSGMSSAGESSSSTTTPSPEPACGDANVDPGEECDPADPSPDAPACNDDCVVSGKLISQFNWDHAGDDVAYALVLWEGDIIIAGFADWEGERDIHVARHAPEGGLRWSFRSGGTGAGPDYARAIASTAEETLLVTGYIRNDPGMAMPIRDDIWIAELDANGIAQWQDTDGTVEGREQGQALVVLDDGDFVIAGRTEATSIDFAVRRYTGVNDMAELVWGDAVDGSEMGGDYAYALVQHPDGRLFAAGSRTQGLNDADRYLRWWSIDGKGAASACDDGTHSRPAEAADEIRGLAVTPDGGIVAVGHSQFGAGEAIDAWLGVYEPDTCTLAWQRSIDGEDGGADRAHAVAVDSAGDIITAGYTRRDDTDDTWLVKWSRDGVGEILWEAEPVNGPGDGPDQLHAIVIDADGSIVVAGQTSGPNDANVWVGRYTP
jgi:uncharacterized delta-60 repeat protein